MKGGAALLTAPFDSLIEAKPAAFDGDPLAAVRLSAGRLFFPLGLLEVDAFLKFPGMVTMCAVQV